MNIKSHLRLDFLKAFDDELDEKIIEFETKEFNKNTFNDIVQQGRRLTHYHIAAKIRKIDQKAENLRKSKNKSDKVEKYAIIYNFDMFISFIC